MAQARAVGVPTPDVLGVAHVDHDGELLAFSINASCRAARSTRSPASCRRRIPSGWSWTAASCWRACTASCPTAASATSPARPTSAPSPAGRASSRRRSVRRRPRSSSAGLSSSVASWLPALRRRWRCAQRLAAKHLLIDDGTIVGVIDWGARRSALAGVRPRPLGGVRWRRPARPLGPAAPRVARSPIPMRLTPGARVRRRLGGRSPRLAYPRLAGTDSAMRGRDRPLRRRLTLTCGQCRTCPRLRGGMMRLSATFRANDCHAPITRRTVPPSSAVR